MKSIKSFKILGNKKSLSKKKLFKMDDQNFEIKKRIPSILEELKNHFNEVADIYLKNNKIYVDIIGDKNFDVKFNISFLNNGKVVFRDCGNTLKKHSFIDEPDFNHYVLMKTNNDFIMTLLKIRTILLNNRKTKEIAYFSDINEVPRSFCYYMVFVMEFLED